MAVADAPVAVAVRSKAYSAYTKAGAIPFGMPRLLYKPCQTVTSQPEREP